MEDLHAVSNFPYTKDPNDDLCLQFTKGVSVNTNDGYDRNRNLILEYVCLIHCSVNQWSAKLCVWQRKIAQVCPSRNV